MKITSILILLFLAALSARGQDDSLYAATGTLGAPGELYILDPSTGAAIENVGALDDSAGNNYSLTGLRFDPNLGILYGITAGTSVTDPNYLVTVDPSTGLVTPIGFLGTRLTDIAFDPTTNTMYGVSGSSKFDYTLNLSTGVATAFGDTGLPPQEGGGLAANSQGALFGVNAFSLYTYDTTSGAASLAGPTGLADFVRALAFGSNGVLYGIEGGSYNESSGMRFLDTIDTSTGVATQIGQSISNLDALAFVPDVPEPGVTASLVLGFGLLGASFRLSKTRRIS